MRINYKCNTSIHFNVKFEIFRTTKKISDIYDLTIKEENMMANNYACINETNVRKVGFSYFTLQNNVYKTNILEFSQLYETL